MKVGFTGTRHGMTDAQLLSLEMLLAARVATEFHHGSCQGADVEAARTARAVRTECVWIICHPGPDGDPHREDSGVDNETLPPLTHFARNRAIVDASDVLVACPFDEQEQARGGTWQTVRYARKRQKKVIIVWPNGSLDQENI